MVGRIVGRVADRVTSKTKNVAAIEVIGEATSGVISKVNNRIKIIGIWIDTTIILTNLWAYISKLEKHSK